MYCMGLKVHPALDNNPPRKKIYILPDRVRSLFSKQGLKERRSDISKRTFIGEMYTGVWMK